MADSPHGDVDFEFAQDSWLPAGWNAPAEPEPIPGPHDDDDDDAPEPDDRPTIWTLSSGYTPFPSVPPNPRYDIEYIMANLVMCTPTKSLTCALCLASSLKAIQFPRQGITNTVTRC